jgi:hypothetical protein
MKATRSLKVKSVLAVLLIAAELFAQLTAFHADAMATEPAPESAPALPDGIHFGSQMTQEDVAYFSASLDYVQAQLPQWWQYVMDARPFTLSFDPTMAANGRAAIAECCDKQGNGQIKFGYHFGQLTMSDNPGSKAVEARRATFLGLLIHELTHVRDQRAGRYTKKTDRKSCVAAESSGLTQQLEVKRDLATRLAHDPSANPAFQAWLDQQVKTEAADLRSRELWDWYCGAFES